MYLPVEFILKSNTYLLAFSDLGIVYLVIISYFARLTDTAIGMLLERLK